jgi:hypothetical protein
MSLAPDGMPDDRRALKSDDVAESSVVDSARGCLAADAPKYRLGSGAADEIQRARLHSLRWDNRNRGLAGVFCVSPRRVRQVAPVPEASMTTPKRLSHHSFDIR